MQIDETYKQWATARQWEKYVAYCEVGAEQAAIDLGVIVSGIRKGVAAMRKKAALNGYCPEADMTKIMAPGFNVKGTSTMYDGEGNVAMQWVKTDRTLEDLEEKIREAVEVLAEDIRGASTIALPGLNQLAKDKNKLSVYPVTDMHVGMLSWAKETGEDQDLNIIEELANDAMEAVVQAQPQSPKGLVCFMGDYFHSDDDSNMTKRGKNLLDCDGRIDKSFAVGIRIAKRLIEKAATHHESVDVIILPGNHDEYLSMSLKYVLKAYYDNATNVNVIMTHGVFAYYEFGATLLAFHHGHTAKPRAMYEVITNDEREAWGRVDMCHCLTGHVHHQSVIDIGMCKIESFRTVAAKDVYTSSGGWRSPRSMFSITYDRNQGECGRAQHNLLPPRG